MAGSAKASKSRKKKRRNSTILFVFEILLLLILVAAIFAYGKVRDSLENFQKSGNTQSEATANDPELVTPSPTIEVNDGVIENEHLAGYRNIAVIGVDSRDGNIDYANSDVMILVSINNDTETVKLLSIYRDTYLNAGGKSGYNKANDAYNRGSATQFLSMINTNLDLAVTDYVVVDFTAVAKLVDDLGGVEVTMTAAEVVHMNNYCVETSQATGMSYERIDPEVEGTYLLNGVQAVAYSRIRYTAGNDFKRTSRQRLIIEKIVEKAKKKGITSYASITEDVFPLIKTNLSKAEVIRLGSQIFNYSIGETGGFPFVLTMDDIGRLDAVIPVTLYENVKELHLWLFDDPSYEPSATVKEYSDYIAEKSGYDESDIEWARALSEQINPDIGSEADGQ